MIYLLYIVALSNEIKHLSHPGAKSVSVECFYFGSEQVRGAVGDGFIFYELLVTAY